MSPDSGGGSEIRVSEWLNQLSAALGDRYRVFGFLGSGGMSSVYRAVDLRRGGEVAIKLSTRSLADFVGQRFRREAIIGAGLHHPAILPVLDAGMAGEHPFYVTPYVSGESLRGRMSRDHRLPIGDAVGFARQVAEALSYAHSSGVLHGDLKPENILLQEGRVRVADFGLTGLTDSGEAPPVSEIVVGTPMYMSPELATRHGQIDSRTDVYSLGLILYEMMAGENPYSGMSIPAILARKAAGSLPTLDAIQKVLPTVLGNVIIKAIALEPNDRFETAADFGEALRKATEVTLIKKAEGDGTPQSPRSEGATEFTQMFLPPGHRGSGGGGRPRDPPSEGPPPPPPAPPQPNEPVRLGASAPRSAAPGSEFTARFVAYIPAIEEEVRKQLLDLSPTAAVHTAVQTVAWKVGTRIRVRLSARNLEIDTASQEFVWNGQREMLAFDVTVPEDALPATTVLKFDALIEGIVVARIRLDLEIAKGATGARTSVTAPAPDTAFASYSSDDRNRVLDRVSAVEIATGMDIYVDCLSLKAGERWKPELEQEIKQRDLFLLFWSSAASRSEWVSWEWHQALGLKGLDGIQLHPLETVDRAPPPEELKELHFGDAFLLARKDP